jgi:hypothetical protein
MTIVNGVFADFLNSFKQRLEEYRYLITGHDDLCSLLPYIT